MSSPEADNRQLFRQIASRLDVQQKDVLKEWISQMLALKVSNAGAFEKARKAIALTANGQVMVATAKVVADSVIPTEVSAVTDELSRIWSSDKSAVSKVKEFSKALFGSLKSAAWGNRSVAARMSLSAAIAGAVVFGGQGAGIAALGTAIGLPLWVVFGAGGAFLGVLYQEITGSNHQGSESTYEIIESKRVNPPK